MPASNPLSRNWQGFLIDSTGKGDYRNSMRLLCVAWICFCAGAAFAAPGESAPMVIFSQDSADLIVKPAKDAPASQKTKHVTIPVVVKDAHLLYAEGFVDLDKPEKNRAIYWRYAQLRQGLLPKAHVSSVRDIALIDGNGEITELFPSLDPATLTDDLVSKSHISGILELISGTIAKEGIKQGDLFVLSKSQPKGTAEF